MPHDYRRKAPTVPAKSKRPRRKDNSKPQPQGTKPSRPKRPSTSEGVSKRDPDRLTIVVPYSDDWEPLMADILGEVDRLLLLQEYPALRWPRFKRWVDCRNAMVRIGQLYWGQIFPKPGAGRPDVSMQMEQAFKEGLKLEKESMDIHYGANGMLLTHGRPLELAEIRLVLKRGASQVDFEEPPSDSLLKKYARYFHIYHYRLDSNEPLSQRDQAFLDRYFSPPFLRPRLGIKYPRK